MNDVLAAHEQRVNNSDKSVRLGRICWYTVPTTVQVSHAEVIKGLTINGINGHMPPYPRGFDVFRRVCSTAQRTKVPTTNPDVFENYLVRDVAGRGENVIVRRIVVESRNSKGRKLDYVGLRDIEFHKDSETIVVKDLEENLGRWNDTGGHYMIKYPVTEEISDSIQAEFKAQSGNLNAYGVREFIRKMVGRAGATMIREGGAVYFVTEDKAAEIEALEKFTNDLPGDSTFHSLPLIDDIKQRQMVKKAFEAETIDKVDEMLAECADIVGSGKKISNEKYIKMVTEFQGLNSRTVEYESLLETGLEEAKSRMSLFKASIVNLRNSVK